MTFSELIDKYEAINPNVIQEIYTAGYERAAEIGIELVSGKKKK